MLCDHGADTRHRTEMGASCVLLAACAPAPNALEEIFKRQGEAPDLRLDKIGKGRVMLKKGEFLFEVSDWEDETSSERTHFLLKIKGCSRYS